MINNSTIISEFLTLIGWRQNPDSAGTQLSTLAPSDSGLYYNDAHPMLTMNNLESIAPDYTKLSGSHDFEDWLSEKTEAGIIQALNDVIIKKSIYKTVNRVLANGQLPSAAYQREKDPTGSYWRGLEIIPQRSSLGVIKIHRVGVQFDTAQTFDLNLFRSDQVTPTTQEVVYTTPGKVQWVDVNWSLDGRMAHYITYDAIAGQSYRSRTKGCGLFALRGVDTGHDVGGEMWNIDHNGYTTSNYGLFIDYSVNTDLTQLFVDNKSTLTSLIQLKVAINLLKEMVFNANARDNRNNINVNTDYLMIDIQGDDTKGGLKRDYDRELKSLAMDYSGLDDIYMKSTHRGAKFGSVYK